MYSHMESQFQVDVVRYHPLAGSGWVQFPDRYIYIFEYYGYL